MTCGLLAGRTGKAENVEVEGEDEVLKYGGSVDRNYVDNMG